MMSFSGPLETPVCDRVAILGNRMPEGILGSPRSPREPESRSDQEGTDGDACAALPKGPWRFRPYVPDGGPLLASGPPFEQNVC